MDRGYIQCHFSILAIWLAAPGKVRAVAAGYASAIRLTRLGIDHQHCAAPAARLIDFPDDEERFLSATILVVSTQLGFARYHALINADRGKGYRFVAPVAREQRQPAPAPLNGTTVGIIRGRRSPASSAGTTSLRR